MSRRNLSIDRAHDLDGPNDLPVVVDEQLLNCPESLDGFHHPNTRVAGVPRSRWGRRCECCGVSLAWPNARPPAALEPAVDHDLIRFGSDFQ